MALNIADFPDGTFGGTAQSGALIRIDNKAINKNLKAFREANQKTQKFYSDAVEEQLRQIFGFKRVGVDASGEADLQELQSKEVASLLAKAQTQGLQEFLTEFQDIPGSEAEVKLSKKFVKVGGQPGEFEAKGAKGKGKRVAERAVAKYGYTPDGLRAAAKEAGMSISEYCVKNLLFKDKRFNAIRIKTKNLFTLVSVQNEKGAVTNYFVFLKNINPKPSDFVASFEREVLHFNYSGSFEKKIEEFVIKGMNTLAEKTIDSVNDAHKRLGGGFVHFAISELSKSKIKTTLRTGPGKGMRAASVKTPKDKKRGLKRKGFAPSMSDLQLTAAVRRSLIKRMPKGPVGGPPKSGTILTYRSGRFVASVTARIRNQLIRYFYEPTYFVHESTPRDPRVLIETSIRNIIRRKLGVEYKIIKQ